MEELKLSEKGRKEVEEAGGKVVIVPYLEGFSSSDIIQRIIRSSEQKKESG